MRWIALNKMGRKKFITLRITAICWLLTAGLLLVAANAGSAVERIVHVGIYDNPPKVFIGDTGRPASLSTSSVTWRSGRAGL